MNRLTKYFAAWPLAILLIAPAGCSDDDPVAPPPDTTAPTISSTNPGDGATGVGVATASFALFSEALNASTSSTSTCALRGPGVTAVGGTVSYAGSS